jgi:hypothetical protein
VVPLLLKTLELSQMNRDPGLMLFAAMAAIGGMDSGTRGGRGYHPQGPAYWDAKRQAKAEKKQQRQNKKRNRR